MIYRQFSKIPTCSSFLPINDFSNQQVNCFQYLLSTGPTLNHLCTSVTICYTWNIPFSQPDSPIVAEFVVSNSIYIKSPFLALQYLSLAFWSRWTYKKNMEIPAKARKRLPLHSIYRWKSCSDVCLTFTPKGPAHLKWLTSPVQTNSSE